MPWLTEDFQDGTYVISWSGTWSVVNYEGGRCLKSQTITDSGSTQITVTAPAGAKKIKFDYKVSSEASYDFFRFQLGGVEKIAVAGAGSWTPSEEFPIAAGDSLVFVYSKDGSQSAGEDSAYVDNIAFWLDDPIPRPPSGLGPAAVHRASRW